MLPIGWNILMAGNIDFYYLNKIWTAIETLKYTFISNDKS